MFKKCVPFLLLPLLMGCNATFTNLTPRQQVRTEKNLYKLEVAMASRQQTIRWDSIRPQIVAGKEHYPMRPVMLMSNRWEGVIPIPPGVNTVRYHYKFDFQVNSFGPPQNDSANSGEYTLRILESAPQ